MPPEPPKRFRVPRWLLRYGAGWGLLVLFLAVMEGLGRPVVQPPVDLLLAILLGAVPGVLYGLHRAALYAEARGWIYYRKTGSSGLGANVMLDLDILLARPRSQVEQVRKVREGRHEARKQDGEADKPHPETPPDEVG